MENIKKHKFDMEKKDKDKMYNQKSKVIWITGLSASGKSTVGNELELLLVRKGYKTIILDGDNVRNGLNIDLGFTEENRKENIRRVSEVAKLFNEAGIIVIATFISPAREDRALAKKIIGEENFVEVYLSTDIAECIRRDPKDLYKKALKKEIKNFTGIDSPYEKPLSPNVNIDTKNTKQKEAAKKIYKNIKRGIKK